MKPVTDPNILAQLEADSAAPAAPVAPEVPQMAGLKPVTDPNVLAELEGPQLRAKFQDPVAYPKLPENNDLDSLLGAATFDMRRRLVELPANILDTSANKVDELANDAMNVFYSMFPPEPQPIDGPDILQAPAGNILSNTLRSGADYLYNIANEQAGQRDQYNATPSIKSWKEVKEAGTENEILPSWVNEKLPRFIAEQGVASLPEMGAAAVPFVGLPTVAASMSERIAEDRAVNQGRTARDVDGEDLLIAAMFGVPLSAAERLGVKGVLPKELLGGSARLGTNAASRLANVGKAGLKEGVTEAIQEPAEMFGGAVGTNADYSLEDYLDAAEAGAVVGGGIGSGMRGGAEAIDVARQSIKGRAAPQTDIGTQPAQVAPPNPMVEPVRTAATPEPVAAETPVQQSPQPPAQPPVTQEPVSKTSVTEPAPVQTAAVQTQEPVQIRKKLVTPNNSMEIEAEDQIVELDDLRTSDAPDYPASRQPRDRSSKRSEAQLTEIYKNFDPERMVDSRTTDTGSPIIGPEDQNFVESGNGRVMTLRRIYNEDPAKAQAYKDTLAKAGYDVSKFKNPVLVRRRRTAMDEATLSRFVEDSNRPTMMAQNETEIAKQDARRLTPEMIGMYKGGSLLSEANADFRNRFVRDIIGSEGEAAGLRDKNGNLSQAGERRVRAAIFQYAYNNDQAVENFFTSADPDLKSIGDVMQDVAPAYAGVRSNAQARGLDSKYDIAKNITDALDMIRTARDGGRAIVDQINQRDMLGGGEINPVTERIVRGLYNKELTRVASKKAIDSFLRGYADKVRNYDPNQGDMLGGGALPEPVKILDDLLSARDAREAAPVQGTLVGTQAPSVKPKRAAPVSDAEMDIAPEKNATPADRKSSEYKTSQVERYIPSSKNWGGVDAESYQVGYKVTYIDQFAGDNTRGYAVREFTYANGEPVSAQVLVEDATNSDGYSLVDNANRKNDAFPVKIFKTKEEAEAVAKKLAGEKQARIEEKTKSGLYKKPQAMKDVQEAELPAQTKKSGGIVAGRNARFEKEAFGDKTAYARSVFVDAGFDPDQASNFTPKRKFEIAKAQLKEKFDIDVDMEGNINIIHALDQVIELYRNLDVMAFELQMTPKSIGLNLKGKNKRGKLKLRLVGKLKGALGVYYPNDQKIGLPGRSNSFAHEWFHALDYKILEDASEEGLNGKFRGFTDKVKKEGVENYQPASVAEAWTGLMSALFFDKAAVAAEISLLEKQLERARSDKKKAEIQEQIDALKDGTTGKINVRTDFYKRASKANKVSGGDYWTRPTEMGARAFEAYVANRVTARGGYTTVLSKTDAAYENSVDPEFMLRYPREEERLNIFLAFDRLFDAMRKEDVLGQAEFDPDVIPDFDGHILDMIDAIRPVRGVTKGMKQRLKNLYEAEARAFKKVSASRSRPNDPRTLWQMTRSTLDAAFTSQRAVISGMMSRYPASKALVEIRNRFVSAPGEGGQLTKGYNDAVDQTAKRYLNQIFGIMKNAGLDMDSEVVQDRLREIMLGNDPKNATPAERRAGAQMRKVLDEIWSYAEKAGYKIGYVRDKGYFPRLLDTVLVKDASNHEKFVKDAIKLYETMFEHEVGTEEDLNLKAFMDFIAEEGNLAILRKSEKANIKQLARMASNLAEETDPAKKEQIKQEIKDFIEETGLYKMVREEYSEKAARAWLSRIVVGGDMDNLGHNAPSGTFKKSRTLPGYADDIMKDWYLRNPSEVLPQYIRGVVRQVEWDKRAKPKGGKSLDDLFAQMKRDEGVQEEDAETIRDLIYNMSGRDNSGAANRDVSRLMSYIHMLGTMTMLTKAAIMSIPEPLVVGLRTGNLGDSLRVYYKALKDIIGTADAQDKRDIVEFAGIYVTNMMHDQAVQNRLGGVFNDAPNVEAKLSKFFIRSGLTWLTNASRRWVAAIHMEHMNRMSQKLVDPNYRHGEMLKKDFQEMGIPMDKQKQFAEFVASFGARGPSLEDLVGDANSGYAPTEMGELYLNALYNLSVNTVMDPNPEDRPRWANTPVGRVVYSITGFLYAFYERVVKRNIKRVREAYRTEGLPYAAGQAAMLGLTFMPLLAAHSALFALRTAIFSPDKDDEWIENGEYMQKVLMGGFGNTGVLGPWDILYNAMYGLRYQRDLANSFLGAHMGYAVQGAEDIITMIGRNSPTTNTAEFNALKGLYSLTVAPAAGYAMASLPGGPLLGAGYGVGAAYLTSTAAKEDFAETVIGPKGSKTTSNFQYSDKEKKGKEKSGFKMKTMKFNE